VLCHNDLEGNIAKFIKERVPKARMKTVFDVGANVGWFTYQTAQQYPEAEFWLFEPVSSIFAEIAPLLGRFSEYNILARAHLHKLAFGHNRGSARISAHPSVTVNKILGHDDLQGPNEEVRVETGDFFCQENGIHHIDFLKIDAEGYDMNVLMGFVNMLSQKKIDFVQVEASMSRDNLAHVPIEAFSAFLETFDYRKFQIIQQGSFEIPYLTRADVVFVQYDAAKAFV